MSRVSFATRAVFDYLAKSVIPDLVRGHALDRPLRIWVAGCSSGEETYSLAMLLREEIIAVEARRQIADLRDRRRSGRGRKRAREAFIPETIEADVSPKRLAQFFTKEDHGYRVSAEMRSWVVFTVHDVLADPPFARLDFVSCRNLLIYLLPEAQAKVISIIHFALREGGLLLVGNAETVGVSDGRFSVVSKPQRIYRRVGGARPGEFALASSSAESVRLRARPGPPPAPSRQAALAELCRRTVLDAYGPAAVLINSKLECLHFQGPTDRYLKIAPGRPGQDLIAMAREGVRAKLRSAVQAALRGNARAAAPGGRDERRCRRDCTSTSSSSPF